MTEVSLTQNQAKVSSSEVLYPWPKDPNINAVLKLYECESEN